MTTKSDDSGAGGGGALIGAITLSLAQIDIVASDDEPMRLLSVNCHARCGGVRQTNEIVLTGNSRRGGASAVRT